VKPVEAIPSLSGFSESSVFGQESSNDFILFVESSSSLF